MSIIFGMVTMKLKTRFIYCSLCAVLSLGIVHELMRSMDQIPLAYTSFSSGMTGEQFNISESSLERYGIPPRRFPYASDEDLAEQFVFVTYASRHFFLQLREATKRIQACCPNKTLVIYDIGLSKSQAKRTQTWCNVVYRRFEFSKYPRHVANLRMYAFKILVWKEALEEFPSAFFMDTSVQMNMRDFREVTRDAVDSGGFLLFSGTGHSNFAVTDPQMYRYFPVDQSLMMRFEQLESVPFIINNRQTYETILHWSYLCALTPGCMYPPGSTVSCQFDKDRFRTYANCHRYDQSIINLLVVDSHVINERTWLYSNREERVFKVRRGIHVNKSHRLKICVGKSWAHQMAQDF